MTVEVLDGRWFLLKIAFHFVASSAMLRSGAFSECEHEIRPRLPLMTRARRNDDARMQISSPSAYPTMDPD